MLELATLGVIHAASLSVYAWQFLVLWVPYVPGQRTEALVALDWTDFEPDEAANLEGRVPPRSLWGA